MRYLALLFSFLLSVSAYAQTDSIFPSQTGETLINSLQANYSVTNPLGYRSARDQMYGSSSIDNTDGTLTGVYTGFKIEVAQNTSTARSESFQKGINTEHTWPQGLFDSNEPMRGDIHHLFPTLEKANSDRGSDPFAEIPDNETTSWMYLDESNWQTSIPTTNINLYSEDASGRFEPREDHKGNVARAIFYFWAIYQDVNNVADDASFFNGMKDVLLTWHDADQVDQAEVNRSLGAESAQGNRNPFIHDTSLVRRAYFDGSGNPEPTLDNPLSGEVVNIQSDVFTVNYSDNGQQKSVQFSFDSGLNTEDPDGASFEISNYETIAAAIIDWQEDQSSTSGRKASKITVEDFGDTPPDTVIGTGSSSSLIITGVFDGALTGGTPKGVELYAIENIADLSFYGIGSANNGGGSDGVEFTFSGSIAKGEFIHIATESDNFNTWFGFNPDHTDDMAVAINGDDAIELFYDSTKTFTGNEFVVDIFGEVDESASSWSYSNGWAYRKDFTGPDGNTFVEGSWTFSGNDAYSGAQNNTSASNPMPIQTFEPSQAVSNENRYFDLPKEVKLSQNYPNPFNPSTTITYQLESAQSINLAVYDQLGRRVALLQNGNFSSGVHQVTFDASGLSSGVYFYRLQTASSILTKKMLLIK